MTARVSIAFVVVVLVGRMAAASTVVVMSEKSRSGELGAALQVSLAGRGVAIATLPAPGGALRLDRAASAQHAAVQVGADAALWIDADAESIDVCAVSSDGRYFRHAPLPLDAGGDGDRMFAAIAMSLLDELIAPPDPAVDVDVHVHVGPQGAVSMVPLATAGAITAPGLADPVVVAASRAADRGRAHADRTLVEVGAMVSPLTIGIEAGLAFPLSPSMRFGVFGIANDLVEKEEPLLGGGVELRHVGLGNHHFDIGAIAGAVGLAKDFDRIDDPLAFAGARVGYVLDGSSVTTEFSLSPILMTDGKSWIPGVWGSVRWAIPL